MAGETIITVVGNLTADPELRFTPSGAAVASFTIASTPRTFDRNTNEWKDGEALFLRCSIWRQAAENAAESLTRGMRVIAQGRLKQRSYETREGEKRTVIELDVDEVGPSLKYASAKVNRTQRGSSTGGGFGSSAVRIRRGGTAPSDDPWGSAPPSAGGGLLRRTALLDHPDHRCANDMTRASTIPHDLEEMQMPKPPIRKPKKKANPLLAAKIDYIDYKDTNLLRKFISDRGKIRARRVTGVSSQQQRQIAKAIKNAREMALLPYTSTAR